MNSKQKNKAYQLALTFAVFSFVLFSACEKSEKIPDPHEIFNSLNGQKITTNGWADMANDGAGLSYSNPENFILIDDTAFPNAAEKRAAFTDAAALDTEKFIIISGDIDFSDGRINDDDKSYFDQFEEEPPYSRKNADFNFRIGSNTTIIGINNARLMFGGLIINGKRNIIIRNVTFYDAHGSTRNDTSKEGYEESKADIDALVVRGDSEGIWVNHCKFTDGICNDMARNYHHDGAFDIVKGKYITVSFCEFTNHDKVMLVANSDSAENAIAEDRQISLHHNYFHKNTQRMPRTRGTQMHVYNNYYDNIGVEDNGGSFMGAGWGAQFIVENNFFGNKAYGKKTIEWFSAPDEYRAKFFYTGNNRADDDIEWWGRESDTVRPWEPAYEYTLEPYKGLPESIPANAGPTLVSKF